MAQETGRSSFPLSEALAMSAQSVRLRLGRMLIVLGGVALAVAFLTSLYVMKGILENFAKVLGGEGESSVLSMGRWWMAVAALIAVTGITNAMLMSVTERVKEIGTLKCLGATWLHILQIFLFEAAFLGLLGGIVGGIVGTLFGIASAAMQLGFEPVLPALKDPMLFLTGIGWGTAISVVLCLLSSIYPVYFAARIEAAAALRYEV